MPKMMLNRNFTLNTTSGHCIGFVKGEPVDVPNLLVQQALSIGAEAVDEAGQAEVEKELRKDDPKEKDPVPTGEARKGKIKEVLEQIAARNQRDDFMASNKPKLPVVKAELDFDVTAEERDTLWEEVLKERADAGA